MLDYYIYPEADWRVCLSCRSVFTPAYWKRTKRCTCPFCAALDLAPKDVEQQGDQSKHEHDHDQDARGTPDVDGVGQDRRKHGVTVPPSRYP